MPPPRVSWCAGFACLAGTLVCGVALVAVAGAVARLHACTRTFPCGGVVGHAHSSLLQTTHPPPPHPPHPTSEGVTPSGDHSSLKFHCGAAASSVRFKQALRRFGGTPQGPLGNAYSGSALTVSNLNGAFVAGALPGSPHCTSKEGCGQTCNFVQGQLKCEDNIKSGSGSGSGSR